jgi:hypothetical protein
MLDIAFYSQDKEEAEAIPFRRNSTRSQTLRRC